MVSGNKLTEAREGPLELRKKIGRENVPGGREAGRHWRAQKRERAYGFSLYIGDMLIMSHETY